MSDVIARPAVFVPPAAASAWPAHMERRRPGRRDDVSPDLIPLMRKPTDEVRRAIALYDAPNFVLPAAPSARGSFGPHQVLRVLTAAGACGLAWGAAFRGMMMLWG